MPSCNLTSKQNEIPGPIPHINIYIYIRINQGKRLTTGTSMYGGL